MSIFRRLTDWLDPTQLPALKGTVAGGAAWGFDRVRMNVDSHADLLLGLPPDRWAAYASMLAACVALVSLFSALPKAFRAAGWYCAQARRSVVCFAGRVARVWQWIRERLK